MSEAVQNLQMPDDIPLSQGDKKIKKIAIFLPHFYRGDTLNGAKNIAKMLHIGSRNLQDPVEIVFSYLPNFYDIDAEFSDLLNLGIGMRETEWKKFSRAEVSCMLHFLHMSNTLKNEFYTLPSDGINNFQDCDFWFFVTDRLKYPLPPLKSYGLIVYDYTQRYIPNIYPEDFDDTSFIALARNAKFILTPTSSIRDDAIQYAGVSPNRVYLAPTEFDPLISENMKITSTEYWMFFRNLI